MPRWDVADIEPQTRAEFDRLGETGVTLLLERGTTGKRRVDACHWLDEKREERDEKRDAKVDSANRAAWTAAGAAIIAAVFAALTYFLK